MKGFKIACGAIKSKWAAFMLFLFTWIAIFLACEYLFFVQDMWPDQFIILIVSIFILIILVDLVYMYYSKYSCESVNDVITYFESQVRNLFKGWEEISSTPLISNFLLFSTLIPICFCFFLYFVDIGLDQQTLEYLLFRRFILLSPSAIFCIPFLLSLSTKLDKKRNHFAGN